LTGFAQGAYANNRFVIANWRQTAMASRPLMTVKNRRRFRR